MMHESGQNQILSIQMVGMRTIMVTYTQAIDVIVQTAESGIAVFWCSEYPLGQQDANPSPARSLCKYTVKSSLPHANTRPCHNLNCSLPT